MSATTRTTNQRGVSKAACVVHACVGCVGSVAVAELAAEHNESWGGFHRAERCVRER